MTPDSIRLTKSKPVIWQGVKYPHTEEQLKEGKEKKKAKKKKQMSLFKLHFKALWWLLKSWLANT